MDFNTESVSAEKMDGEAGDAAGLDKDQLTKIERETGTRMPREVTSSRRDVFSVFIAGSFALESHQG
ncbi:MAG: hypothetical protein KAS32_20865 [Candidatus Peribacteraceae bacterium]|nr:hypothetical protein [Candidatus Peribacteraceae bacterium]